jgi:3-oxoacyl-(acyl-carrier-protein) synthase
MNQRVVVTGIGAVSALGQTADVLWDGLLKSRSGIKRIQRFVDAGLPVTTGGDIDSISPDLAHQDEFIATSAIDEAIAEAGAEKIRSGFLWSTGLDSFNYNGHGLVRHPTGSCFSALAVGFGNPRRMIATACASGTQAIGEAFHLIRSGKIKMCLAGGSSAMLSPFYLIGFAGIQALAIDQQNEDPSTACRPFDRTRKGFALSNGAGALVLESLESAFNRGVEILAEIVGYGMSQDAFDLNRPSPDGVGAELCIRRAISDANIAEESVEAINAHGTGTVLGDAAEAAAVRRVFRNNWRQLPVSSVKGAVGHAQSAAGALEAIVSIKTCITGIVPPTVNLHEPDEDCELDHVMESPRNAGSTTVLSTSFGMGGQNAALILKRYST